PVAGVRPRGDDEPGLLEIAQHPGRPARTGSSVADVERIHSADDPNTAVSRLVGPNPGRRARDTEEALSRDVPLRRPAQRLELVLADVAARTGEVEEMLELGDLQILRTGNGLDHDVDEERREFLVHRLHRESLTRHRPLAVGRRRGQLADLANVVEADDRG